MPKLVQVQLQRSGAVPFGDSKFATVSHPVMWNHAFTVLLQKKHTVKLAAMMKGLHGIKLGCREMFFMIAFLIKNMIY